MDNLMKMHFKIVILLIAFCTLSNASPLQLKEMTTTIKYNLSQLLLKSIAKLQSNPERSSECFGAFSTQMNILTTQYETQHQECIDTAESSRSAANAEIAAQRDSLTTSAADICVSFKNCNKQVDSWAFFNCYAQASNSATKSAKSLGNDANDIVQTIDHRYAEIDFNQQRCTDAAANTFKQNIDKITEEFNDCLSGKTPAVSTAPETASAIAATAA